jgi:hypothetical protein
MKKNLFLTILTVLASLSLSSQVEKTVVVEHFTNTRCSVCASKNPGFYQNLANHPHILHLAIHPSSPYNNCLLHLHNPTENDGRTNYYGVYGGTPRLVIQGVPQSFSINFNSPEIFDPFEGQTTPFSMKIKEYRIGNDSVSVEIIIKAVSGHSVEQASLFLGYAEDTVFYVSPNGEAEHYDVFRKAFNGHEGSIVAMPSTGDSIVLSHGITVNEEWDPGRMKVIGILQDQETKEVIQAGQTTSVEYFSSIFTSKNEDKGSLYLFPNPAKNHVTVQKVSGITKLYSLDGRILISVNSGDRSNDVRIDLSGLAPGIYLIRNNQNYSLLNKL